MGQKQFAVHLSRMIKIKDIKLGRQGYAFQEALFARCIYIVLNLIFCHRTGNHLDYYSLDVCTVEIFICLFYSIAVSFLLGLSHILIFVQKLRLAFVIAFFSFSFFFSGKVGVIIRHLQMFILWLN